MNSSITCISNPNELDLTNSYWTMNYLTSQPKDNILRLIVSPFDDLRDGFYVYKLENNSKLVGFGKFVIQ